MADTKRSAEQEFTVASSQEAGIGVITLSGNIYGSVEQGLVGAYEGFERANIRSLRIHFSGHYIVTSAGIAVLITIAARERKKKRTITVTGLTPHYRKIFEMIGLSDYVEMG